MPEPKRDPMQRPPPAPPIDTPAWHFPYAGGGPPSPPPPPPPGSAREIGYSGCEADETPGAEAVHIANNAYNTYLITKGFWRSGVYVPWPDHEGTYETVDVTKLQDNIVGGLPSCPENAIPDAPGVLITIDIEAPWWYPWRTPQFYTDADAQAVLDNVYLIVINTIAAIRPQATLSLYQMQDMGPFTGGDNYPNRMSMLRQMHSLVHRIAPSAYLQGDTASYTEQLPPVSNAFANKLLNSFAMSAQQSNKPVYVWLWDQYKSPLTFHSGCIADPELQPWLAYWAKYNILGFHHLGGVGSPTSPSRNTCIINCQEEMRLALDNTTIIPPPYEAPLPP